MPVTKLAISTGIGALTVAALIGAGPAWGSVAHGEIVSPTPAASTPNVPQATGNAVYAYGQVADTMYAGGKIPQIEQVAPYPATITAHNLVAFSATTGAVNTAFLPSFNGAVWALMPAPDGVGLFVGGEFSTVNDSTAKGLVEINKTTGAVMTGFKPMITSSYANDDVYDLRLVGGRLIVGGDFTFVGGRATTALAALDPTTGANTGYLNAGVSGSEPNAGYTRVYRMRENPAGTALVAVGNFTSVGGVTHENAVRIDLGATATVSSWDAPRLHVPCSAGEPAFLRGVDWDPTGTYFVLVGTGYISPQGLDHGLCDSASRWEGASTSSQSQPTWINWTGGDTLHSVAVTGATVYVPGHQRWLDNPFGRDSCGANNVGTCSPRPGIGSIDPTTGMATSWNPTRSRQVGAKVLYATSSGLWVGSDGAYLANQYHSCIGFLPLPS